MNTPPLMQSHVCYVSTKAVVCSVVCSVVVTMKRRRVSRSRLNLDCGNQWRTQKFSKERALGCREEKYRVEDTIILSLLFCQCVLN